jgi:hypothetical protein
MLLGDDLLPLLVLAFGAAMAVGSGVALVRPPTRHPSDGELERPPLARSLTMIAIGVMASLWAIASLVVG